MRATVWWLRIVGAFYLLLAAGNLAAVFFTDGSFFAGTLPGGMGADPLAIRAFEDAWMVFAFELGVLGAMSIFASRVPVQGRILILAIVWAEVFRGIVADAIWIGRGYSATQYGAFIAIHLVIITTGWWILRREKAAAAPGFPR